MEDIMYFYLQTFYRSGLVKSGVPLMQAMPQKVVQREGTVHPVKENDKADVRNILMFAKILWKI